MTMNAPSPGQPNINSATLGKLIEPEHKLAPVPTWTIAANISRYSYLSVLLLFAPGSWACVRSFLLTSITPVFFPSLRSPRLGVPFRLPPLGPFTFPLARLHRLDGSANTYISSHFTEKDPSSIPLAALLGSATEEFTLSIGQTLGGLLTATLDNTVESIIVVVALVKGELRVVPASMLGSILSNCLLVLGMCFFAGGLQFHEQGYGIRAAQLNISLLCISVFSIVIPAAFHASLNSALTSGGQTTGEAAGQTPAIEQAHVLAISRGTSIILLVVYAAYLFFQLWTHAYIYTAEASAHHAAQTFEAGTDGPGAPPAQRVFHMPSLPSLPSLFHHSSSTSSTSSVSSESTEEDDTVPKLKTQATLGLLVLVTVLTGITAEWLVDSIDGLTSSGTISREFVALILLPLVGNAAEHVTA
ncbi:hypothetical protein FS749_012215, partial [Ceratobasidium sp. UAMH 11750]